MRGIEDFKEGEWVKNPDSKGDFDFYILLTKAQADRYNKLGLDEKQKIVKVPAEAVKAYYISEVKEHEAKPPPEKFKADYFVGLLREHFGE